jgi:SAM-dependent methyltransferase
LSHPERILPDETEPGVVALHLKRYRFAEPWCRGREVLDAACGVGYGSAELGRVARKVLGVDVDPDAIAYATARYAAPNVEFAIMDLAALTLEDESFDTVCAFEAIEHVRDREAVLAEVARVLRAEGTFLLSTPCVEQTTDRPENPFHTVEYAPADLERLLLRFFDQVEVYGQRRLQTRRYRVLRRLDVLGLRRRLRPPRAVAALVGTRPTANLTLDDVVIERGALERASEVIAVCVGPRRTPRR